jgi:isocitrate dehydrogenase (NAD+)
VRIAGDGVGAELVAAATSVIAATGLDVNWVDMPAGLAAYETTGMTAPLETLDAIRTHRYAIKGPFATPSGGEIRSANYYIRRDLDLYICLRPLPIDPGRPALLVRENVEDLYGAIEWVTDGTAHAVKVASRRGCERIARYAFELAVRERREKVTFVHKANNLKRTEGLFLDVARGVARDYQGVEFDDVLADTACARFITDPLGFDVILTSNTFGDLLGSLGAAVAGGLGVVGSLNSGHGVHVAEAGHGDASELAGRDLANPLAILDSTRLLLREIGFTREAEALQQALREVRERGPLPAELGGTASTSEVASNVAATVASDLGR